MLKCDDCGYEFNEPSEIRTTYESYYGVSSMFGNSTPLILATCPYCGHDSFHEMNEEEEDDE